jgi:membrane dipeptidase
MTRLPVPRHTPAQRWVGPSVGLALAALLASAAVPAAADEIAERARRIHADAIVIDTHIDTTQRLLRPEWSFFERHQPPDPAARGRGTGNHVDYPRMREGGLDAAFFSIFISGETTGPIAVRRALEQIDAVRRLAEQHPEEMVLATSAADVRAAHKTGRVATLMGVEGGHMIDDSLAMLRSFAGLGVSYLTLTHSEHTGWADSSGHPAKHDGLTAFGKDVVRELNRLGMMVDVSHVSDKTFWDALATSRAPLLASHSSCRALAGHPRNMTDEMIKALAAKGGVIQINFMAGYIDNDLYLAQEARRPRTEALRAELERKLPGPENAEKRMTEMRAAMAAIEPPLPKVSWERIVDHIDHAAKLAGPEHVGLGSDFDGAGMPLGMEDCSQLPKITEALLRKGYSEAQVRGVLGENLLRLMERVAQVAAERDVPARAGR